MRCIIVSFTVDLEHAASNLYLSAITERHTDDESDRLLTNIKWAMTDNSLKQMDITIGYSASNSMGFMEVG